MASGSSAAPERWRGFRELLRRPRGPDGRATAGLTALARLARQVERAVDARHTGRAATCCRMVSGPVFASAREAMSAVRTRPVHLVHWEWDAHGNQWALLEGPSLEGLSLAALDLQATLSARGFAGLLEWTVFGLADRDHRPLHLVHSHRRDTFHPFAPRGGLKRDEAAERTMAAALFGLLPVEPDPSQWIPLWGVPVGPSAG